jgi:hypothetical protein
MLDKVEKVFPEALPAVQRQSIALRLIILSAVLLLPIFAIIGLSPLKNLLLQGATIQVPIRLLAVVVVTAVIVGLAVSLRFARLHRRARLRDFVRQWVEMRRRFELLHIQIDGWLVRTDRSIEDPLFDKILESIQDYSARRASLRRLLFLLGEGSLVAKENQHWLELKSKESVFKDRDYATPFGFLLDIGAPIESINHHGRAIWAALFISDDFLEHLKYKYPFLEKTAA